MMKYKLLSLISISFAVVVLTSACKPEQTVPQDGDIVFHESTSRQSPVIKLAQHSKWTHCGIVFHIGEKAYVYEAVEPVKYTPLKDWIARGKNGVYCAKRLKQSLSYIVINESISIFENINAANPGMLPKWIKNLLKGSKQSINKGGKTK